jgi:hypothetical protein
LKEFAAADGGWIFEIENKAKKIKKLEKGWGGSREA